MFQFLHIINVLGLISMCVIATGPTGLPGQLSRKQTMGRGNGRGFNSGASCGSGGGRRQEQGCCGYTVSVCGMISLR